MVKSAEADAWTSTHGADLAAILELRRHGATRARSGTMEAEWQSPPEVVETDPPNQQRPETDAERKQRIDRELFHSGG